MNIEEKYTELLEKFKTDAANAVKDMTDAIHGDLLPHVEEDTIMNVDYRAQEAVNKLLEGKFEKISEHHVSVQLHSGIHVPIRITSNQYDSLRKSLLEVMDACPKDLEIQSLKDQIKHLNEYRPY